MGSVTLGVVTEPSSGPSWTSIVPLRITNSAPDWAADTQYGGAGVDGGFQYTVNNANDGPYTYSLTAGTLPTGLELTNTGKLWRTPTVANSFNFTIQVDGQNQTYTQVENVTITATPWTIDGGLAGGTVGSAYSETYAATGSTAPLTWELVSGAFPPNLTLTAATGTLAGTPAAADQGNWSWTIKVTDANGEIATLDDGIAIAGTPAPTAPTNLAGAWD